MGHIHLHVSSVKDAVGFYRDVLGMGLMLDMGSAGFLAYDGYHHHVGVNTWRGKLPPPEDALGLSHYQLHLTDTARLDAAVENLQQLGYRLEQTENVWHFNDPAANHIHLVAGE